MKKNFDMFFTVTLTFVLYSVNQVILMLISKSICFPLTTTQNAKV